MSSGGKLVIKVLEARIPKVTEIQGKKVNIFVQIEYKAVMHRSFAISEEGRSPKWNYIFPAFLVPSLREIQSNPR